MAAALRHVLACCLVLMGLQLCAAMTVQHKVLLITLDSPTDYTGFAAQACTAYGIPYDLIKLNGDNAPSYNWSSYLLTSNTDAAGNPIGKYSAIFMYPHLEWWPFTSGGYAFDWAAIVAMREYMSTYDVRRVEFGVYPPSLGTTGDAAHSISASNPSLTTLPSYSLPLVCNTDGLSSVGIGAAAGINCANIKNGGIDTSGLAKNPVQLDSLGTAHTPILTFLPGQDYTANTAAAVVSTLPDYNGNNFQQMSFFFDCATWSTPCLLMSHVWIHWAMRDLIPGERRVELNTQVDDMLLSSPSPSSPDGTYRIAAYEMVQHVNWMATINAALPAGSAYKTETVVNGNGPLITAQAMGLNFDPTNIDDPISASGNGYPKNFAKPDGVGTNMINSTTLGLNSKKWDIALINTVDTLSNALTNNEVVRNGFNYGHHTWSHEELDNATYHDTYAQLYTNKLMVGPNYLNMASLPTWSSNCMVTPGISGLLNNDALRAIEDNGITAGVGDNTYPTLLVNGAMPYQPLISQGVFSTGKKNYTAFTIVPRFATEVYYGVTTTAEEEAGYAAMYSATVGDLTWPQILSREADRVVNNLLLLRHDAHMFHQGNLRMNGTGTSQYAPYEWDSLFYGSSSPPSERSLLMNWVEQIVYRYLQYVDWPVTSVKLDDSFTAYKTRVVRDNCALSYQFTATNGAVSAVTVTSGSGASGTCVAPLMATSAASGTGVTSTQVGNMYLNTCTFTAGSSCTFKLGSSTPWTD